jgi:hypothetical protein
VSGSSWNDWPEKRLPSNVVYKTAIHCSLVIQEFNN